MKNEVNITTPADIGRSLLEHSQKGDLDNKRGVVIKLFPFIFGASERMSARAISRFLEEKHGVRLSAVTITKALNDPRKSWGRFFDTIEPHIEVYENWEKTAKREKFLYDDESFKVLKFPGREIVRKYLLKFQLTQALDELRKSWFSIDLNLRIKARPYLAERLIPKTVTK